MPAGCDTCRYKKEEDENGPALFHVCFLFLALLDSFVKRVSVHFWQDAAQPSRYARQ